MKTVQTRIAQYQGCRKPYFVPQIKRFGFWRPFKEWKVERPFPARYMEVTFEELSEARAFIEDEIAKMKQKASAPKRKSFWSLFDGPKVIDETSHWI